LTSAEQVTPQDHVVDDGEIISTKELEGLRNILERITPFMLSCTSAASEVDGSARGEACKHRPNVVGTRHREGAECAPVGARESTMWFPADAGEIRRARDFVRSTISDWGFGRIADDAAVIISELAGNSIRHADSAFFVTVSSHRSDLRLSVGDASELQPTTRESSPSANAGRGLVLVAALSDSWGVESSPGGKIVWADLRR